MRLKILLVLISMVVGTKVGWASMSADMPPFESIQVWVNEQRVFFPDQRPVLDRESAKYFIPVRAVCGRMNCDVSWENNTVVVTDQVNGNKIVFGLDTTTALVNGTEQEVGVKPMLVHGWVLVPLRFVSESLGYQVDYNEDSIHHTTVIKIYD